MPPPASGCTFEGTATQIHISGKGAAVLTKREAFSAGHAARVKLREASVGRAKLPDDAIVRPSSLEPVRPNRRDADYDVTYTAGPPFEVRIDRGASEGHYQGPLAGTSCDEEDGCPVEWPAGPRIITVEPAGPGPVAVSGRFPFGRGESAAGAVEQVSLARATGWLTCGGEARELEGESLTWRTGVDLVKPIELRSAGLFAVVEARAEPEIQGAALHLAARVGAGVVGAALLVGGGMLLRRRLFRRGVRPAAPVDVLLIDAPQDAALAEALERHLRPLRAELCVHRIQALIGGADVALEREALLARAKLIVPLVSADLLAANDLEPLIAGAQRRCEAGTAKVLPVVLRPCIWDSEPFGKIPALNAEAVSLSEDQDEALREIADALRAAAGRALLDSHVELAR